MHEPITLVGTEQLENSIESRCTVCGQQSWANLREGRDLRRPNCAKVFKLTRCRSCGHVMQNPLPDAGELSRAYAAEYAPYRPAWKEKGRPLWKILRELTTLRRVRRLKRYARGSRLLEVGSGAGDFLYAAKRAGWEVAAVEYSKTLADLLRSELSFDVRSGELTRGTWQPESFDLVVLWSVLEHVPDPLETLAIVASYLKPGGTAFIQLPIVSALQIGKPFGQYWENLDLPRHLNFFDKECLSRLCGKAGMKLAVFKTPLLDVGWAYLTSCSNYANCSRSRAQRYIRLALLTPIIFAVLPYMAVQAWRGRGTEAFVVAVKN